MHYTISIGKSLGLVALFIVALALATMTAFAQSSTTSGSTSSTTIALSDTSDSDVQEFLFTAPLQSSGYGALCMKFTPIQGKFATMLGGYGGWFINKTLLIGAGGYGLTSSIGSETRKGDNIALGYGGIVLEYVGASDKVFHYTVQGFVGWGGVGYYPAVGRYTADYRNLTSGMLVIEPSVLAELNLTSFLRIAVGVGYRFVSGVQLDGLTNGDLSRYAGSLGIKFGSF
jgi:hypothetical protein